MRKIEKLLVLFFDLKFYFKGVQNTIVKRYVTKSSSLTVNDQEVMIYFDYYLVKIDFFELIFLHGGYIY